MTYEDIFAMLKENFGKAGETDKSGIYHYVNGGNEVALINKAGGWVFRLVDFSGVYPFLKYSIDKNGKMKNGGKYYKADFTDLQKVFARSDMYAVLTPDAKTQDKFKFNTIN